MSLYGEPLKIVFERDKIFVSRFWKSFHEAMGTEVCLSTTYHPQTDGQTKRTNQMSKDMLRICILNFGEGWE